MENVYPMNEQNPVQDVCQQVLFLVRIDLMREKYVV